MLVRSCPGKVVAQGVAEQQGEAGVPGQSSDVTWSGGILSREGWGKASLAENLLAARPRQSAQSPRHLSVSFSALWGPQQELGG